LQALQIACPILQQLLPPSVRKTDSRRPADAEID
jgi:hypothetical protein